ncbi:MAG: hypothetical protein CMF74_12090 [Maricaulis sp.]|jgi:hypothetical protein|nr:hypothetical protein [Maricaulis sp.]HAQ34522.1 hypothetical protein [Alphaproteobacteria bacterium]|tara:strand:+ start:44 stop:751 length:708 start_codon:yes stop_codon:yes gene_type:complete
MTTANSEVLAELSAAYYSGARDEVVERIRLRDASMTIFLSSVSIIGALYGGLVAYLDTTPAIILYGSYLLILVCVLANASASVISQHHVLIGALEHYLVTELDPHLRRIGVTLPQWDLSGSVMGMKDYSIRSRSKGHQLLIIRIAVTSAAFFVVLQATLGPHVPFIVGFWTSDAGFWAYLSEQSGRLLEITISVLATFIALSSVKSASDAINSASVQRGKYMDSMNAYIASLERT